MDICFIQERKKQNCSPYSNGLMGKITYTFGHTQKTRKCDGEKICLALEKGKKTHNQNLVWTEEKCRVCVCVCVLRKRGFYGYGCFNAEF